MEIPQKIKKKLPYDPVIPLPSIYAKNIKALIQKDTCTPMFIAALFTIAKIWKQTKHPSTDEWIKMWCIYTVGYYSAIKKDEILLFVTTWIDLPLMEEDKYCMISLICGLKQTNQNK